MRWKRGITLVELLIVMAIIGLLLAVVIPKSREIKNNATETVVIREVQTIYQAQLQYSSQFNRYAGSLAELGPGPGGANLIPRSLASGEKDGYIFTLSKTPEGFTVQAVPRVFGTTGRRTFYLDQDGVVHHNWGQEPATVNRPEIGEESQK